MRWRALLPLLAAHGLAGCATQSLTLLPDENGRTGAIAILDAASGSAGTVIDTADTRTSLSGTPRTRPIDPARLSAGERELLQALPRPPFRATLYFEQDSTRLTPQSLASVAAIEAELARRPGAELQIIGHTDTVGTTEDNDRLSLMRAREMLSVLAARGIDRSIMRAYGRGERELRQPTPDDTAEPANRRIDILVQ